MNLRTITAAGLPLKMNHEATIEWRERRPVSPPSLPPGLAEPLMSSDQSGASLKLRLRVPSAVGNDR